MKASKRHRKSRPSKHSAAVEGLRHSAEKQLKLRKRAQRDGVPKLRSEADTQRSLHELQVHQIELEMQNEELQTARDRIEVLLEKYTDLYDFAPVGYFSLNEEGRILEVNLSGATLLGMERARLINKSLLRSVVPTSRPALLAFLKRVFTRPGKQVCEAEVRRQDGSRFWADFHASNTVSGDNSREFCRVAVSDISALKRAEEAQGRIEILATANRELQREIVRRQAVEESLKTSQKRHSRLLAQSRQMQSQLRHLSRQLMRSQEEERKRISRELHDDIAQTLVGITVHLENLARETTVEPEKLRLKIARTQGLVKKAVNIVRRFALELRPAALDDLGLTAALHSLMKDFMKQTGVRVEFTTFSAVEQLATSRRTVLYRVVQSALTNVAQHAQASEVKVEFKRDGRKVHLEISDNGKSFKVDQVLQSKLAKHLGLLGMRERIEMIGGDFSVESAPGQGTTIRVQIPFHNGIRG